MAFPLIDNRALGRGFLGPQVQQVPARRPAIRRPVAFMGQNAVAAVDEASKELAKAERVFRKIRDSYAKLVIAIGADKAKSAYEEARAGFENARAAYAQAVEISRTAEAS